VRFARYSRVMVASNDKPPERPQGLEPWAVNLIVAAIVVLLLATMVWLAHALTHAGDVIDCAARGIRNCG